MGWTGGAVTGMHLAAFGCMKGLKILDVSDATIDAMDIGELAGLSGLTALCLDRCMRVTESTPTRGKVREGWG